MFVLMRFLSTCVLALLAFCALASASFGATPKPTVTSFSPAQVPVGGTVVLKGKNFRSGAKNDRVFLSRVSDGKAVRVRPKKASKTRIELVVPSTVTNFLVGGKATRFQVAVFTKVLGPKTKKTRSPIILPAGSSPAAPGTPGAPGAPGTPGAPGSSTGPALTPPPPPDCDAD